MPESIEASPMNRRPNSAVHTGRPSKRNCPSFLLRLLLVAVLAAGSLNSTAAGSPRPRVGLVLGGGGARGAAHIGVLEVLERLRVPVDCVAGTSMGALVAGAFAAGLTPTQMRSELAKANWDDMFRDDPPFYEQNYRRKASDRRFLPASETGVGPDGVKYQTGIISGQKIKLFFNQLVHSDLGERNIESLPLPLSIIATDIVRGERVVMRSGSLTSAMRASMSVPGLMSPVAVDGKKLVDGGLVDNVPIGEVHSRCQADVVIAVNVGSPLLKAEDIGGLLSVSAQMVNLLTEQNVSRSLATLAEDDIYLKPDLDGISAADFQRTGETADRGARAAEAAADRLGLLAVDEATYTAWSRNLRIGQRAAPQIDQVEIAGLKRVNPAAVERHLQVKPGDRMDPAAVNTQLLRAYGDGYYEHVDYALTRTLRGRNILRVSPLEKSWGPDYLRYGINLDTNFAANSSYGLRVAYHKTWLNEFGGEILSQAEIGSQPGIMLDYYQPVDARQRYFAESSLKISSRLSGIYLDDQRLADYKITEKVFRLGMGTNLGLLGQLRAGWKETWHDAERDTGLPIFPEQSLRFGGWSATLDMDQTDRLYFPTKGWSTRLQYFDSRSDNYSTLDGAASGYASSGDWVLSGKLSYQGSPQGRRPFHDIGSLGGMLNMTAFSPGQLKGDDLRYGQLRAERIIGRLPLGLRGDLRLGVALESAKIGHPMTETNLRGWIKSGAIYIGGETPLGPVYLGYGYSNAGATGGYANLYLFLGTP